MEATWRPINEAPVAAECHVASRRVREAQLCGHRLALGMRGDGHVANAANTHCEAAVQRGHQCNLDDVSRCGGSDCYSARRVSSAADCEGLVSGVLEQVRLTVEADFLLSDVRGIVQIQVPTQVANAAIETSARPTRELFLSDCPILKAEMEGGVGALYGGIELLEDAPASRWRTKDSVIQGVSASRWVCALSDGLVANQWREVRPIAVGQHPSGAPPEQGCRAQRRRELRRRYRGDHAPTLPLAITRKPELCEASASDENSCAHDAGPSVRGEELVLFVPLRLRASGPLGIHPTDLLPRPFQDHLVVIGAALQLHAWHADGQGRYLWIRAQLARPELLEL
mmetsp:Transcript_47506/g.125450  ORF Transcript_47506/g.125450 Transcript_47506/m.125450 type:complete len:341 (+) Transcript_47506:617-1639(+)